MDSNRSHSKLPDGRQTGSWPETGFWDVWSNAQVLTNTVNRQVKVSLVKSLPNLPTEEQLACYVFSQDGTADLGSTHYIGSGEWCLPCRGLRGKARCS